MGNTNNPPDIIIRNGDAIEVKKISVKVSSISLNSSYPKQYIYSDSKMITDKCRECEDWIKKELFYVIGSVDSDKKLGSCWIVQGKCYVAPDGVYSRIKDSLSDIMHNDGTFEFSPTNEIGRVNRVDPLGITYLRIRGMWGIEHPYRVFKNLNIVSEEESKRSFVLIIMRDKFDQLSKEDYDQIKSLKEKVCMKEVKIPNPDNPAQYENAVVLVYIGK